MIINVFRAVAHVFSTDGRTSAVSDNVRPLSGGVAQDGAVGRPVEHPRVADACVVSVRQVRVVRSVASRSRRNVHLGTRHR